jgi:hypothetical protein
MEQIVIHVRNKEKAALLFKLLRSLDFVEAIETSEETVQTETADDEFFALAGIWADREVNQTYLRRQAWPRQAS